MTQPLQPMPLAAHPPRTSKSAIFSLIFGILGCIPFITGALAMLLGLVGFIKTGNPSVKGRWMAVIGGLLGTVSVVIWALSIGFLFALFGWATEPMNATGEFMRAMSAGDPAAVAAGSHNLAPAQLAAAQTAVLPLGPFKSASYNDVQYVNGDWNFGGVASFEKGDKRFTVKLVKSSDKWKVTNIEFH